MKYSRKIIAIACVLAVVLLFAPGAHAFSEPEEQLECNETATAQSGVANVPSGQYDVYVKRDAASDERTFTVLTMHVDGGNDCQVVGATTGVAATWTKVGAYQETGGLGKVGWYVDDGVEKDTVTASRLRVLLVPSAQQICVLAADCSISLGGEAGIIRPVTTELASNDIVIQRIVDPSTDVIEKVEYYIDGQYAYARERLEPFGSDDTRVLSASSTSRVIYYASGQSIVLSSTAQAQSLPSIVAFIWQYLEPYSGAMKALFGVGFIIGTVLLLRMVLVRYRKRRAWLEGHGLATAQSESSLRRITDRVVRVSSSGIDSLARIGEYLIIPLVILGAIGLYGGEVQRVSGQSMEATHRDGEFMVLSKVPVSAAALSGKRFVPQRGAVIVARVGLTASSYQDSFGANRATMIKRVIGLPSERVIVSDSTITVFNAQHPEGFDPDAGASWQKTGNLESESMYVDVQLAQDELFVVGDNRSASSDSRINGPIKTSQVIGQVIAGF